MLFTFVSTFQFTKANFQQPYLLGSLAKSDEIDLPRKPRKLAFTWIKWHANWSCHLGDMGQKVQHMQAGQKITAWEKKAPLDQ